MTNLPSTDLIIRPILAMDFTNRSSSLASKSFPMTIRPVPLAWIRLASDRDFFSGRKKPGGSIDSALQLDKNECGLVLALVLALFRTSLFSSHARLAVPG